MAAAHNHARRVGGDLQLLAGRRFAKRIQPYGGIVRQLNLHPSRTRSTEMSQNEQVIFGRQLIAITKDVVLSRIGNGKSRSLQPALCNPISPKSQEVAIPSEHCFILAVRIRALGAGKGCGVGRRPCSFPGVLRIFASPSAIDCSAQVGIVEVDKERETCSRGVLLSHEHQWNGGIQQEQGRCRLLSFR